MKIPAVYGFLDFHILLWAASPNHHGLPMAVIKIIRSVVIKRVDHNGKVKMLIQAKRYASIDIKKQPWQIIKLLPRLFFGKLGGGGLRNRDSKGLMNRHE